MHDGVDALFRQVRGQAIPPRRADHVAVVDVPVVGPLGRGDDFGAGQQVVVTRRSRPALLGPLFEMRQLGAQDRRLQRIQPRAPAQLHVLVLADPAVVAQPADARQQRGIAPGDHAAVAVAAQVLAGIEAEARQIAQAAAAPAVMLGRVRLRRVLDHPQAVPPGDGQDRVHVGRLAVEMHRHDGPRARRDRRLDLGRIQVVGIGRNVDKHRRRAGLVDRLGGRVEGERGCDHLIARADAARQERQVQRRSARSDPDRGLGADKAGESLLERSDLRPHDEAGALHTRWIAASTSGLMAAYCAFKSTTGIMSVNDGSPWAKVKTRPTRRVGPSVPQVGDDAGILLGQTLWGNPHSSAGRLNEITAAAREDRAAR